MVNRQMGPRTSTLPVEPLSYTFVISIFTTILNTRLFVEVILPLS